MNAGIAEPSAVATNTRQKNRLPDSEFSQQNTPSWEPVITVSTIWIVFVLMGAVFIVLGSLLLVFSRQPAEIRIPYSYPAANECLNPYNEIKNRRSKCHSCTSGSESDYWCDSIYFDVLEDLELPVYMYYEIENFYQNHRRYVKSRDDNQLLGHLMDKSGPIEPSSSCAPFDKDDKQRIYFPCGAIANSMFSDVLVIKKKDHSMSMNLSLDETTWASERYYKFKNPKKISSVADFNKKYSDHFIKPKDWSDTFWKEWWSLGGLQNPNFINWMHPAPNPTFRKLYGKINNAPGCKKHYLCKGKYQLEVNYRFDVDRFKGTKSVILAKMSFMGSQNPLIGWFIIGIGIVGVLSGVAFFLLGKRHKSRVHPRRRSNSFSQNHRLSQPQAISRVETEAQVVSQPLLQTEHHRPHRLSLPQTQPERQLSSTNEPGPSLQYSYVKDRVGKEKEN